MAGLVSVFSLILASSMAAAISVVHEEQNPPAIFVFGDSLSDVGNNNFLPDGYHANFPHYGVDFPNGVATGRFTNGYNFIDIMAQHMGFDQSPPANGSLTKPEDALKGVNFASGGSGILVDCMDGTAKKCFTMEEQIESFKNVSLWLQLALGSKASSELIAKSIFIFTCGNNDINDFFNEYFNEYFFLLPFAPIDEFVANMTSALRDQLKELYDLGGRKFAIINVPALGMIPTARALDVLEVFGIHVQKILNGYAQKFNEAEYMMLNKLSSTLPGMKYSIGNAYRAMLDVTSYPEEFGFTNVINPCCGEVHFVFAIPPVNITHCSPTAWLCSNHSEYVFWDNIHPTLPVIKYASEQFYSGIPPYANPINLKQLVEYESFSGGVVDSLGGIEAM